MSNLKKTSSKDNFFKMIDSHILAEQKKEEKELKDYLGILEINEKIFIDMYKELIKNLKDTKGELSEIYEEIDTTKKEIKNQSEIYKKIKDTIEILYLWEPNLYKSMKERYEQINELNEQLQFMLNTQELEKEKEMNEEQLFNERNIFKILENKVNDLKQHIKELKESRSDIKKERKKYTIIMDNINKLLMHRKNNQNIIAKIKKELEQKQDYINTDTLINRFKKLKSTSPILSNSPKVNKSKTPKRFSPIIDIEDKRKSPKLKGGKKQKNKKTMRKNRKKNKKKTIRKK